MDTHGLQFIAKGHSHPFVFATITGSHAFGCASPTSDYDIHGAHLLSLQDVLGLEYPHETLERKTFHPEDGLEVDIATHDLRKFVFLLLKGNGNVLEDLYSPFRVITSPLHGELCILGKGCITKQLALHYKGMAYNQQRRMKANELKKYIHMFRCLLMGIHLMRSGELEMHLPTLALEYRLTLIHDLIAYKMQGFNYLPDQEIPHCTEYIEMLTTRLELEREISVLPETVPETIRKQLEQFVIQTRLKEHRDAYEYSISRGE